MTHEREHGFGGCLEFLVGDVEDDLGGADAGGEDVSAFAAAIFLVGVGEGYEFGGGGFEGREWAVGQDDAGHAVGLLLGDGASGYGYVEGDDAAPGYGFPVEDLFVVGGGLDGVAEGVAEVEDHAQAELFFVLVDDVGFDADGGGDYSGEGGLFLRRGFFCEDGGYVFLEVGEEFGVVDDAGFDGLLQASAELVGGQGAEEVSVGEDGLGVVEGADEVFTSEEVDAGLAADGGVYLREQGGGELDVTDTAHVNGGEEAGDVADDSATEGEEEGVAVGSGEGELLGEGLDGSHAFVGLAGGVEEDYGLAGAFGGEGGEDGLGPQLPDLGRGDDEGAVGLGGVELFEAGGEGAEEAGADGDIVGCRGRFDGNGRHDTAMVSQRFGAMRGSSI